MGFDEQGFRQAAKGFGYDDNTIEMVAQMAKNKQSNAFKFTGNKAQDLQTVITDPSSKISASDVSAYYDAANPAGDKTNFKFTGNYKSDLEKATQLGVPTSSVNDYYKPILENAKTARAKAEFYRTNTANAKSILHLMDQKNKGLIDDNAYKTQLNLLASKQASHIGFGIGGKVISEAEKAILQPQMANLAKSTTTQKGSLPQRIWGSMTGSPVPEKTITKEELADSEDQLRQKMLATILNDPALPQAQKQAYQKWAESNGTPTQTGPQFQGGWNGFRGNPVENAANEARGMVQGAVDYLDPTKPNPADKGGILSFLDVTKTFPAAAEQAKGLGESLGRTLGFGVRPDGSISWDPVDIARHAWNNPIETAAWAYAAKGSLKKPSASSGGMTVDEAIKPNMAQKVATKGKGIIEGTLETTTGGGTKDLVKSNILKDQAESLNKTLLDHNIYKYTDKGRIEATQKALVDEGNALVKTYANSGGGLNTSVLDKAVDEIMAKNGVTDQAARIQIRDTLTQSGVFDFKTNSSTLTNSQLWDLAKKADEFGPKAFNIPNIGPQAKAVTKDIGRYIRSYLDEQVPKARPHLRAYANLRTYMDDILPDPSGLQVKGAMSIMNVMANATNALLGKPLEVAGQKAYNVLDKIAPEAQTAVPSATMQSSPALASGEPLFTKTGGGRRPLETMPTIESNLERSKPAQTRRLIRDMRYPQGNFQPRKTQEAFLRRSKGAKYR